MATSVAQVAHLQHEARELAQDEVYDSAALLGSFLVGLSGSATEPLPLVGEGSHLESLIIFADILRAKGETRRAVTYYKKAVSEQRSIAASGRSAVKGGASKGSGSSSASASSAAGRDGTRRFGSPVAAAQSSEPGLDGHASIGEAKDQDTGNRALSNLEAELTFRIARCYAKLKDKQQALKLLESIEPGLRRPTMSLYIAQLYSELGMDRPTVSALRVGVQGSPYALAGVQALLRIGVSPSEVSQAVCSDARAEDIEWLSNFVQAHGACSLSQHKTALDSFLQLNKRVPQQHSVLARIAEQYMELGDENSAAKYFYKARAEDPKALDLMDKLAALLRDSFNDRPRLNFLARDLMAIDETRPEPWVAAAIFCDYKNDPMVALQFVSKALELDPMHVPAYHLKGALQLAMNQPELSVSAMYKAYSIRRDFHSYQGLVNAYLAIPKVSEALRTAKEALQLMPKDARAVLLVGRVLAQTPGEGRKKASKAYAKALKLDPNCFEAALAFADLYLAQHNSDPNFDLQPAVQVIAQTIAHASSEALFVKLGDLYTASGDFDAGLIEYHNALSVNINSDAARAGIDRLEKLLRGADAEGDEDGDYDLENEDYGDQDI